MGHLENGKTPSHRGLQSNRLAVSQGTMLDRQATPKMRTPHWDLRIELIERTRKANRFVQAKTWWRESQRDVNVYNGSTMGMRRMRRAAGAQQPRVREAMADKIVTSRGLSLHLWHAVKWAIHSLIQYLWIHMKITDASLLVTWTYVCGSSVDEQKWPAFPCRFLVFIT